MSEFDQTPVGQIAVRIANAVDKALSDDERVAMHDFLLTRELRNEKAAEEKKQEALEAKNLSFVQYSLPVGIDKLIQLIDEDKAAAKVFLTIIKLMDRRNGLVASQKTLADMMQVDKAVISRSVKHLVEQKYVKKIDLGGVPLFAINHDHVWRDKNNRRRFSLWDANVLVDATVQREYLAKSTAVALPKGRKTNRVESKV